MNPRFRHLFFSPDETPGDGGTTNPPENDDGLKLKEALKELGALRKERDALKVQADTYRGKLNETQRGKIVEQLVEPKYAQFLPQLEFGDDGNLAEQSAKLFEAFRGEYPEMFKSADAEPNKKGANQEEPKGERKPVPPAGNGNKGQSYWDDLKKNNYKKWAEPATQRQYADWLEKQP